MPIALVTGGGSGIGRAAAAALAGAGFTVVVAGRRMHRLEETAALVGGAVAWPADVTDEDSIAALFSFIYNEYGRLDLLFNNAGTAMLPTLVEDVRLADWRAVIDVNITGMFVCARAAFRLMKRQQPQGGRIINNGSISAHVPRPLATAYTVSKHAVTGLTKSLSLEGRACNIACGQIDIGNAETTMTAAMKTGALQADGRMAPEPLMPIEAVGRSVAYMAGLPLDSNVQFLTVMATAMPYIGRG